MAQDEYRPLPVFYPELAKVSIGISQRNHLAVLSQVSPKLVQIDPEIAAKFDRAAAAFLREFSQGEKLTGADLVRDGGALPSVGQATEEIAHRDGATIDLNDKC